MLLPNCIICRRELMNWAVNFDNESCSSAVEIDDEAVDCVLTSEPGAGTSPAQRLPEPIFRLGRLGPLRARERLQPSPEIRF